MGLLDVYSNLTGHQPRKTGPKEWSGPCPGCGGDDRFQLWPERSLDESCWWCRQCGKRGDLPGLLMEFKGLSYPEARLQVGMDSGQAGSKLTGDAGKGQEEKRRAGSAKALAMLLQAKPLKGNHPYLKRKGVIPPIGLRVDSQGRLVVPVLGQDSSVQSLQFIAPDGSKRFLAGTSVAGGYFPVRVDETGPLYLGEGLASMASVAEAMPQGEVWSAFSATNLVKVAKYARSSYPDRQIILCADNDCETEGNPGFKWADSAACAVSGLVARPNLGGQKCDFNDMHLAKGVKNVRAQIEAARQPVPADAEPDNQSNESLASEPGLVKDDDHRLKVVSAEVFIDLDLPQRGMLLSPILPEQGTAMLYGPRGLGKTFMALSLAVAAASGGGVLKYEAPNPTGVLYIDGEMSGAAMQERLSKILIGAECPEAAAKNFQIITPDLQNRPIPNLARPEGQGELDPLLEDVQLLVLDNLSCLLAHGKENESESWRPVQEWLLRLRRQGKSVLIVHHAGKNGEQRGTSKREDILDTVIALKKPAGYCQSEGASMEIHLEKARGLFGPEAEPYTAKLIETDEGGLQWSIGSLARDDRATVLKLTREGMSVRNIETETGLSKSRVSRIQGSLRAEGVLS